MKILYIVLPLYCADYYSTPLFPLVGADDVSGEQWQPVADIHVEGVGLILRE
jgi:hypothetical protein